MSGEISASKRPINSLLETDLDFQMAQRLPEAATEEVGCKLNVDTYICDRIHSGYRRVGRIDSPENHS